jgi:hypothetical protein
MIDPFVSTIVISQLLSNSSSSFLLQFRNYDGLKGLCEKTWLRGLTKLTQSEEKNEL